MHVPAGGAMLMRPIAAARLQSQHQRPAAPGSPPGVCIGRTARWPAMARAAVTVKAKPA
ncbi:MAG: hypothetical protein WKG07_06725 [Hymenobacter sp.]